MTRKYTPYVDDFTGEEIGRDDQRYTVEFIRITEKFGNLVKSKPLDIGHTTFKKLVIDKVGDGILKWKEGNKNPDGSWTWVEAK